MPRAISDASRKSASTATRPSYTVELLDWAYGGKRPSALENIALEELPAPAAAEDSAPGTQASAVVKLHKKTMPDGDDVGIW